MTIVYAAVSRAKDATIFSEVCDRDVKGTVGPVMVELLQHLSQHPDFFQDGDRKTFVQRNDSETDFFSHFIEACAAAIGDESGEDSTEHYVHLLYKDEVFYCCLGDDPDTRDQKVNFAFLDHIQLEFVKMHRLGRIRTANAYAFDNNFAPTMRSAMHYHNIHHKELRQEEKVVRLLAQVQDIRDVMGRNLNLILERGEKFEGILAKSDALQADASVFRKRSRHAKRILQQRYYFWFAVLAGILIFILYIATAGVCGPSLQRCRNSNGNGNSGNNDEQENDGKF